VVWCGVANILPRYLIFSHLFYGGASAKVRANPLIGISAPPPPVSALLITKSGGGRADLPNKLTGLLHISRELRLQTMLDRVVLRDTV